MNMYEQLLIVIFADVILTHSRCDNYSDFLAMFLLHIYACMPAGDVQAKHLYNAQHGERSHSIAAVPAAATTKIHHISASARPDDNLAASL
eukprot:scaffold3092_cov153-Skeletonema_marinoi.AAC.10